MDKDTEHLRYLTIGFYVWAGITALFSLLPIVHVVIGFLIAAGSFDTAEGQPPPPFMGYMFMGIGVSIIVIGLTLALLNFLTARFLSARKNWMFCFILAAVNCLNAPFGTLLGVFTIIVLLRDPVKAMFGRPVSG